jgi:hypothetical protein
VSEYAFTSIP